MLWLSLCVHRGEDDYHMEYVPAPRITDADKKNDTKYVPFFQICEIFICIHSLANLNYFGFICIFGFIFISLR